jgi:hypothetical protein
VTEAVLAQLEPGTLRPAGSPPPPPVPVPGRSGTQPAVAAARWFDRRRDSLLALLRQAIREEQWDLGWRVGVALSPFLEQRADPSQWAEVDRLATQAAERSGNVAARGWVLLGTAERHRYRGDLPAGVGAYQRAAAVFADLGDAGGQALALCGAGDLLSGARDDAGGRRLDEAEEATRRSLELFERVRNEAGRASAITGLGEVAALRADLGGRSGASDAAALRLHWLTEAARLFEQSRDSYARLGNAPHEAGVLRILAIMHRSLGRAADAAAELAECVDRFRNLDDSAGLARALLTLSSTWYEINGAGDKAVAAAEEAYGIIEQLRDVFWQGKAAMHLGKLLLDLGRRTEALDLLAVAADRFRQLGHDELVAECARLVGPA